jgi:hypothetical protein
MDTSFHTFYNEHLEYQFALYFDGVNVLHVNINTITRNTEDIFDAGKDGARINLEEIEVNFMSMYRYRNVGEDIM